MSGAAPTSGAQAPTPDASAWPMARAMVGVGLGCGLLIVAVVEWTRPVIARNRAEALERAVFQVLPGAVERAAFAATEGGRFVPAAASEAAGRLVHAGYDSEGRLVGVAIEASGMGYQDRIELLYGYAFEAQAIVGLRVLASRETPGLGDRIETDPDFVASFEALDVSLMPDGSAPQNPIEAVKRGEKQHPWQVDGITGATISAEAVARILRESSAARIPGLWARREDFQQGRAEP